MASLVQWFRKFRTTAARQLTLNAVENLQLGFRTQNTRRPNDVDDVLSMNAT